MTHLAFVLLKTDSPPDSGALQQALVRRAPTHGFRAAEREQSEDNTDALGFEFNLGRVFVLFFPTPVPAGEADEGFQFSIGTFSEDLTAPEHNAHVAVTMLLDEELPAVEAQSLFTRVLAAVVETTGAVGVYWGSTSATHPAQFFLDVASGSESLWLMLWTGVSRARDGSNPNRISLLSLGMQQFNLPNMMVNGPIDSEDDPMMFLLDMLTYTIERGEAIPDGDTVGRTEGEKLRVVHEPSPIEENEVICRIDLP